MTKLPTIPPKPGPGLINGPVLDTAHWAMNVRYLDPNTHRLKNAVGLTMGLYVGRKTMDLLVGQTPSGDKIERDEVPLPLRPLHGVLAYNHFSDNPSDRWMKVFDNWLPAVLGAGGAMAGSYDFAMDQSQYKAVKTAQKNLEMLTIDQAEMWAKATQSHPWRLMSGATSMFGSASGFSLIPGLHNYGSTLGPSFMNSVTRDKEATPYWKGLQKFISGNNHKYPYGPASMLSRFRDYMVHNPVQSPKEEREMAYAIMEPWFGNQVTQKHIDDFVKEVHTVRDKFFKEGGVPEALRGNCSKEIDAIMTGLGLEKTFKNIGLDPSKATIGRNGFNEFMSRMLGYGKQLDEIETQYKLAYAERHNLAAPTESVLGKALRRQIHPGDGKVLRVGGWIAAAGAAAIGYMALNSRRWHQDDNDALFKRNPNETDPIKPPQSGKKIELPAQPKSSWAEAINGKPLGFMEWATDGLNSSETLSTHRLSCAFGMTIGGYTGAKFMEALTGRDIFGKAVPKEKVPEFLHGIYNKLKYNPHSDSHKDRWGFVMHLIVPSLMASAGIIAASSNFFKGRKRTLDKAEYIDDYENKMTMAQAAPWTFLTGASSLLAAPSGAIFLPIPGINYGMTLGTRYTLSSGRKVIFPGLGEAWTNTQSRYPMGPATLRDHMIKYAVNNPSANPEQLEEMAIGILKPWFSNISEKQIESFIDKIQDDREKFLKTGGIPEERKRECEKLLLSHFKGAGLEKTLQEIGLDPLKATLAENGFSGKLANWLGASGRMKELQKEYADKYTERLRASREQPAPSLVV